MSSSSVVHQVISHIIKQGKDALHDQYIFKEKVPTFSKSHLESHTQEFIIHGGFKAETLKKYSHLSLKSDKIPQSISKDNLANKSSQVTRQHKSLIKSPLTFKSSHNSISHHDLELYSSKKKNRENNSFVGNSSFNAIPQNPLKERENRMVRLEENNANRIVVERAKLREEY
jgi:hypothetical protein